MALYTLRNYVSVAAHYTAAGGVAAASVALGVAVTGMPLVVAGAATFVVASTAVGVLFQRKIFEKSLVEHPKSSPYAPRLGKTADELYKASGLKAENHPIYDFRVTDTFGNEKTEAKQGPAQSGEKKKKSGIGSIFGQAAEMPNAAAINLGKPVIMISDPLLRMLDDTEEKAVLAHEFGHAAARHTRLMIPKSVILGASGFINRIASITAMLSAGVIGFGASFLSGCAARIGYNHLSGKAKLLNTDNDSLSLPDLIKKRKALSRGAMLCGAVTAGAIAFVQPAFLPVYAVVLGLSAASKLISGSFSQSIEFQADRAAVQLGGDPLALITSLRKMEIVHERSFKEAFGGAMPKKGFLTRAWQTATSTHPTSKKRFKRLVKMAKKQGRTEADIQAAVSGPLDVGPEHNIPFKVIDAIVKGL